MVSCCGGGSGCGDCWYSACGFSGGFCGCGACGSGCRAYTGVVAVIMVVVVMVFDGGGGTGKNNLGLLLLQSEPLKLQYLILDKDKLLAAQDEESADPVLDVLPEDNPLIDDPPPTVSGISADLPLSDIQSSPGLDDPPEEKSPVVLPVSTETLVSSTPAEPGIVHSNSTTKKKRGRKPKSPESSKTLSDNIHFSKNYLESVDVNKPTSPETSTEATSNADFKPAKKRGRKRKSDSVLFRTSADRKNDEFQSKKRSSRLSDSCVQDMVSADVSIRNQDKSVKKKPKALTPSERPPSAPDCVVPERKSSEDGDKQLAKADEVSNSCENRIGTLKISLDGQHSVRNVTSPKDHADPRLNDEKKGHFEDNFIKGPYRLKRKDDLRVQLSRKIKPQGEEDIHREQSVVTGDRKKTFRIKKTAQQLQQRTRKRVEASKVEISDTLRRDHLNIALRQSDNKKCARVVPALSSPGGDSGSSEGELCGGRSPVIRKKRSPSITETPSPVVYDRDIETLPFLKRGNDKKVHRFLGRKSVLGKVTKAVSISTIPPTFVLAAERKQGNQSRRDETVDDREPVSLKVVLRMIDDRKRAVAHDRTDDCFMVSSTVADDEAELAGAAGSGNSVDESPESGTCESRPAPDKRAESSTCSEPTRLPACATSELSPFVRLVSSESPSLATPGKSLTVDDVLRPLPSAVEVVHENKALVPPSTGSAVSVKVDPGAKRKRLESVISSLKPVASVLVSTDAKQPAPSGQPSIPNVAAAAARDPGTRNKYLPPAGFIQSLERPKDATPSLLHRLVSREPLNIPIPPMRHQWQPLRGAVYPPTRFPPGSHYPVRAQGQSREPRSAQRQQHPRAPRRAPTGQQVRAVRYPTATNAHLAAAAAYAMGILEAQRHQVRPSVNYRGLTPEQERLRFFAGANAVRSGVVRTRPPEPNGYDAPLELTTKKSRDVPAGLPLRM